MQIDLRTVSIEPKRLAFDHLVRRFGNKPASRYQEGSYDIQAMENLHYRPTWDPEQAIYDAGITKIVMADWHSLKDPRQFYYSTYTLARARQQETTEANFAFVESRGLADILPDELRATALMLLMPLRHAAWGANQHNTFICGYGYGTPFTQPCIYQAMDNLGIAQYLSRLGMLLGDTDALIEGKRAWTQDPAWQALRRYVEDCLVLRDPFELFVAQNFVLDGLLYPLIYGRIVDVHLAQRGGSSVAMLTQFMTDWSAETSKWVDAVVKVAATESLANTSVLTSWVRNWTERASAAMLPITALALGAEAEGAIEEELENLQFRAKQCGITAEEV